MTLENELPKNESPKNMDDLTPPEEFYKIINDFTTDIKLTFPEYSHLINKWWSPINEENPVNPEIIKKETLYVFRHCLKTIPERFFDILYKTVDIFSNDSDINTEFLPGIVFKHLWSYEITDNTRTTIWNYLQLISFAVIGSVNNVSDLGDTAKLFESINETELKTKLQETLESMKNLFNNSSTDGDGEHDSFSGINVPNAGDIHDHISSMMGGKLGKLAMELAEETAGNLNLDMENVSDANDVFQKLFSNPTKMMDMVKNIGSKIDTKIKSGEIKESELMEEGMGLLNKMKNMPGMGDMSKMFSQMGIPGLGKGAKLNMGAMEAQLDRNMKNSKLKERLRAKADGKAMVKALEQIVKPLVDTISVEDRLKADEELFKIFSTGEKVERTPRGTKPPENKNKNKKK